MLLTFWVGGIYHLFYLIHFLHGLNPFLLLCILLYRFFIIAIFTLNIYFIILLFHFIQFFSGVRFMICKTNKPPNASEPGSPPQFIGNVTKLHATVHPSRLVILQYLSAFLLSFSVLFDFDFDFLSNFFWIITFIFASFQFYINFSYFMFLIIIILYLIFSSTFIHIFQTWHVAVF